MQKYQEADRTKSGSLPIPQQYRQVLKQLNCPILELSELVSGVKLARLVNRVLYEGNNSVLANQIITQNQQRKGNNVINMNMILKQVKSNTKYQTPPHIQQLTTFKLIDSEQQMLNFIQWIIQCYKSQYANKFINSKSQKQDQKQVKTANQIIQINSSYLHKQRRLASSNNQEFQYQEQQYKQIPQLQNQISQYENEQKDQNLFQNVFFCDRDLSPQKNNMLNDSLQLSDKISKKGSFKVVRPKTIFSDKQSGSKKQIASPQKYQQVQNNQSKMINNFLNEQRYYSEQKQSSNRKTIPKMHQRPPIYRKYNKQQTKSQSISKDRNPISFKQPSAFLMQNQTNESKINKYQQIKVQQKENQNKIRQRGPSLVSQVKNKNHSMLGDIKNIEQQINKQKRQILKQSKYINQRNQTILMNSNISSNKSMHGSSKIKSSRKIFKLQIKEVSEAQRKSIVQWLISINLLNSMATNYYDRFHEICKNGVIFPQIINHHKGRSNQLYYFKNPIKSAEVHSNYQKVFAYLKELPNFQSQLLYMYDYFVPEALESAFWSLLRSCQQSFQKTFQSKPKSFNRDSLIKQRLKTKTDSQTNSRILSQKAQSFNKSQNKSKLQKQNQYTKLRYGGSNLKIKQSNVKVIQSKIESPKTIKAQKQQKNKRKSSLDFIKQLPQRTQNKNRCEQLIQIEQPTQTNKMNKGYRQLHELKKNHNTSSYINTPKKGQIINRSRIISTNSIKKSGQKPQAPSVSLQMQMKAVKYLKEKGHLNLMTMQSVPLFEDNIRNGVLFNKIIKDQFIINYKYVQRPRNIIQCRQNFATGFAQLRQMFVLIPSSYQHHYQEIIKGEITIFYGLVWFIINLATNKVSLSMGFNGFKNQSAILNISKNFNNFDSNSDQSQLQQILFWMRQIQQQSSEIASMHIRDFNGIVCNILSNNLMYKIASLILSQKYTIKPIYQHPLNQMQQESNLRKILAFYSHNKVLRSDLAWKYKGMVKKQKKTIVAILKQLMDYNKNAKKTEVQAVKQDNPVISFVKFTRQNSKQHIKNNERSKQRLQTTMANNSFAVQVKKQSQPKPEIPIIQVPWLRKLGFTQDLSINNGVILCRLVSKLTMQSIIFNQTPNSKAQCLTNIRKALKLIDKFKWDQQDVVSADQKTTLQIYKFLKEKYKHSYALKML